MPRHTTASDLAGSGATADPSGGDTSPSGGDTSPSGGGPSPSGGGRSGGDGRGILRRWSADLALGARFAISGGREGWIRTLLTAVGVGLGAAVLLLAASIPALLDARDGRADDRNIGSFVEPADVGEETLLYKMADTTFREQEILGRVVQPAGDPALAPVPPGLSELPAPGETAVSPALADLLEQDDAALLAERIPGEITGTVGDDGLLDPGELVYWSGGEDLDFRQSGVGATNAFGPTPYGGSEGLDPVLMLMVTMGCVVLLMPVAAFIATAVRLGGQRRDERLAALRLVGADIRMTHRIAAGEALVGALAGLLVGAALFFFSRQFAGDLEAFRLNAFPSDIQPHPLITLLILIAVPVVAVGVTLQALRRIAIEPLGVVRDTATRRRRVWWRLLPPLAGLALLLPLLGTVDQSGESPPVVPVTAGIVLLLLGITAVLPWAVERVVHLLRGGPLSFQLAARRMQMDSGPPTRAVSGISIAVAGAIAAHTFIGGVFGDYVQFGDDSHGADSSSWIELSDSAAVRELEQDLLARDGITSVTSFRAVQAVPLSEPDTEEAITVWVGSCEGLSQFADRHLEECADGRVLELVPQVPQPDEPRVQPGQEVLIRGEAAPEHGWPQEVLGEPIPWTVPQDLRTVELTDPGTEELTDDGYQPPSMLLVTEEAIDLGALGPLTAHLAIDLDRGVPDALEQARTGMSLGDPAATVFRHNGDFTLVDENFDAVERALYAGATAVLLLIGASLVVSTLEQLRERRRLLSVLVAFGTPRSTLAWSVLWQTLLPVALGLMVAIGGGLGLGWVLLSLGDAPFDVDWGAVAVVTGLGALVIIGSALASMPSLYRMMRAGGLRSE